MNANQLKAADDADRKMDKIGTKLVGAPNEQTEQWSGTIATLKNAAMDIGEYYATATPQEQSEMIEHLILSAKNTNIDEAIRGLRLP